MIHFQISPPKVSKKPVVNPNEESARPAYLTLGTFGQVPKIHFERVQLGESKLRVLNIRNPTENEVWLKFTKKPSSKFQLNCATENVIPPKDQLVVEIRWVPTEEGPCFEAFHCQSSLSGIKLSVHLMGECTPAPRKPPAAARRRVLAKMPEPSQGPRSASLPRANDPSLQLKPDHSKSKISMTLPRSPRRENTRKSGSGAQTSTSCISKNLAPISTEDSENEEILNLENMPPNEEYKGNITRNFSQKNPVPHTPATGNVTSTLGMQSVLDKLDTFAFPFTPEPRRAFNASVTKSAVAQMPHISEVKIDSNEMRRETFIVDDDSQFTPDASMSSRRDTYLVPRTLDPEAELKPKKLDFVEEQDSVEVNSTTKPAISPTKLNETIIYERATSTNLPSSDEEDHNSMESKIDGPTNHIVDMTFNTLNSEAEASKRPQQYKCQTETISDAESDSDSEDDEDRAVASVLEEIQDLELMVKAFLAKLPVTVTVGSS